MPPIGLRRPGRSYLVRVAVRGRRIRLHIASKQSVYDGFAGLGRFAIGLDTGAAPNVGLTTNHEYMVNSTAGAAP